jgi:nitric oxide synthase oxygenase domain/subunit
VCPSLCRYAGYRDPDTGKVLGDPAEADFTAMVIKDFGWTPPAGAPGRFDLLPVLLQSHPDEDPQVPGEELWETCSDWRAGG